MNDENGVVSPWKGERTRLRVGGFYIKCTT
jgi:hypothetical protein